MLRLLLSLHLTLGLLLGLAFMAIWGTLQPVADGRYAVYYQSHWFRLLLALLALNLTVCTVKTLLRNLRDRSRLLAQLDSEQPLASPLRAVLATETDSASLVAALRRQGYRVDQAGERLLGRHGWAGRWGSTLVHLSVLFLMAGALAGELGFVGTLNIHIGKTSEVYFDWDRKADVPLGFTFRLDHFEPRFYPIELRFEAIDPASGQVLQKYQVKEGEVVQLPRAGLSARVVSFIPFEKRLILELIGNGVSLGEYQGLPAPMQLNNPIDPGFELRPTEFRDPILKQMHSEVSILEGGKVVQQGVIEVNSPLVHRGVRIYQTAFDQDQYGFWYAGFQFSRDPGEMVVWVCCVLLVLGLGAAFFIPWRVVGVYRSEGTLLLVALGGFRGEGGGVAFNRLADSLSSEVAAES